MYFNASERNGMKNLSVFFREWKYKFIPLAYSTYI